MRMRVHAPLALLLLAALAPHARAACSYDLALPAAGAGDAAETAGWCAPYFAMGGAHSTSDVVLCEGISVPAGATLEFGTCALPGAACTGATRLELQDAASGAGLKSLGRVALKSSVAKLSQGCVLGVRCSYGEWRNPALAPADVHIEEHCYGEGACLGVVAWRVGADARLLPALVPTTTPALAFTVTALEAASLTHLTGAINASATTLGVWWRAGNAFNGSALDSNAGWTSLYSSSWSASGAATLTSPLALAAGATVTLLVESGTAGISLSCAHTLGNASTFGSASARLLADDVLAVSQGGALTAAFAGGPVGACAWSGLALSYNVTAACAPPPPPPLPLISTSTPTTLVGSLDDLLRALANPAVNDIQINDHIALNGTQLSAALLPAGSAGAGTRTLKIEGTNACRTADPTTPLCSLDAGGASRVLVVQAGLQLRIGYLLLTSGLAPVGAPGGASGGCILADCAGCSVFLDNSVLRNCTAAARGGGAAVQGGGALRVVATQFIANTAAQGGGLLLADGALAISGCAFRDNTAIGDTDDTTVVLGDLRGPAGGGAALDNVTGTLANSSFANNDATTEDVVLLSNPDFPQARGGGLFLAHSTVNMSGSTFTSCTAAWGGGVYVHASTFEMSANAFVGNLATTGDGGGLFAGDCPRVFANATLITGNAAGGHMGGGFGAINTDFDLDNAAFSNNAAHNGCGGGMGLDAGSTLSIHFGSVLFNNSARSGGAICCDSCVSMWTEESFMHHNTATHDSGGAIFITSSPTGIRNVSLVGNHAPAGGAVSSVSSQLNLTDCLISDNVAVYTHGGAVLHDAIDNMSEELLMTRCTVANNSCNGGGGAVAALESLAVVLTSCLFEGNSITASAPAGGAVYAQDVGDLVLRNSTFLHNTVHVVRALAEDAPLGYVSGVAALGFGLGGAVWVGSNDPVRATVLGSNFTRNYAGSGGAMYATGLVHLTVQWSDFTHDHATDWDGRGGALVTDSTAVAEVLDTYFYSCEANRGGVAWHGGASMTTYTRCFFDENEGIDGDDMKGMALQVTDTASLTVTGSTFLRNFGPPLAEGTIALAGTNSSHLNVTDSVFDSNVAHFGACLFITVPSQKQQLSLSGVTFRNNIGDVGGVLFTEARPEETEELNCHPLPCIVSNNSATLYGPDAATPPLQFLITMPTAIRSGAPLPINVTLLDGFNQTVTDWIDTVAQIATTAMVSGSLRAFYQHSSAVFSSITLKGNETASYDLDITLTGPDLFGNDINSRSLSQSVLVQACEAAEAFNPVDLVCTCAPGFGLVLEDATCRLCTADEVIPPGSLSCATCPALSAPTSPTSDTCECFAGYFGTIFGATGACTQCPADTYRSATDAPEACLACPVTSNTFALGAQSATDCLCDVNTFNAANGVNATFSCAAVPEGGWAPRADSRLFALKDYWRPGPEVTEFFPCAAGNCNREQLPANGTLQQGYSCRNHHTGHLCSVCEDGTAYIGLYCLPCNPVDRFSNWGAAKAGALLFFGVLLLCVLIFGLFFLPLCPRVEALLQRAMDPAAQRLESMIGNMVQVAARMSGTARPRSAASRPTSAANRAEAPLHRQSSTVRRQSSSLTRQSLLAARTRAIRRTSFSTTAAAPDAEGEAVARPHVKVQRPSRISVVLDLISKPLRIIISFWQIVSSFSSNLYVPWPSIYYSLANSLEVVSLQFLKLPALACVQPELSFYVIFNGVTITTLLFVIFCTATYHLGQRTTVAKNDPARRRRFKTQCLNCFIWGIFLIYPQVSATTLLIFACTRLENDTYWLAADYRIQCYTPKHRMHVGLGAFWTLLFPFGIPVVIVYLLYRSRVPDLAVWKRECAWLRNVAQRALIVGVKTEREFDPDTITTESITLEHLRMLHRLFVEGELDEEGLTRASALPGVLVLPKTLEERSMHSGTVSVHHAPRRTSDGTRRARLSATSVPSALMSAVTPPSNRLLALLAVAKAQITTASKLRSKSIRRTLSTMLAGRTEREHLLQQLLEWAKHDKSSLISEPRDNQLRWRSQFEWQALREEEAHLGARDTTERAAYFKFRFLFADYSCHAWYWESVDLFQKLFLTSIIAFIAPRTAVQVIVACVFSFGMVLFTIQVKPFRERAYNQLVSLSQVNLYLFLWTGLLLQTNPDGINENKVIFSVVVGGLTTSIVGFTLWLFLREMWQQLMTALLTLQDEEDEELDELEADEEEADAERRSRASESDGGADVQHAWDDGEGGDADADALGVSMLAAPSGGDAAADDEAPGPLPDSPAAAGTPPPPDWVARLTTPPERGDAAL